jgi:dolichol-phosphate mannosyltransferase
MTVSIILPTYCERENILDLLEAIQANLPALGQQVEILIVDDNSPDGTAEMAERWRPTPPTSVQCLVRRDQRGLATAIRLGIEKSRGQTMVVMDTDFNHDPRMIPQMVKFLDHYDLVIGSRFVMGGGMEEHRRYVYSLFYNMFVRFLLQMQVQDNLSGFYAIRREKLLALDLGAIYQGYGDYFIRLLYAAWRRGYRMLEVPVFYVIRRHGQSKSRFLAMARDYTRCVLWLWLKRPQL